MKLEPIEVSSFEASEVWKYMPHSPVQAVIHNELVRKILEDRDHFEKCDPGEISGIQQRILARRELLGFIHRSDKPTNQ